MQQNRVFTVPNLLSFARIPLAAAFVAVHGTTARLALISAAALTDLLDGWFARQGASTRVGALLDPIADKTFVLLALSAFLFDGSLTTRDYFIVISRDLATAVGLIVAHYLPGLEVTDFKARLSGKVLTTLQIAALFVILLEPGWLAWYIWVVAMCSAWAIIDYTMYLSRTRRKA